jgi:hypothetical protein
MVNGGFAYGYLFMSQHHDSPKIFKELLYKVKPARILEIGTFHGGLTLLLRDILDGLSLYYRPIRTYDINSQDFLKPLVKDRNVEVITDNLFNENYTNFRNQEKKEELATFIQKSGTTMVLCDGGCKTCEFNLISPLLKTNDIIMAHDYAPNDDYFQLHLKDKIWNWHEISQKDIVESIDKYKLVPFLDELMQSIAWGSFIKT